MKRFRSQMTDTPRARRITRADFMDFFRSEDGYASLTPDDRREVFFDIIRGNGDLTLDLVGELFERYCLPDERALVEAAPALLSECRWNLRVAREALRSGWKSKPHPWRVMIKRLEAVIARAEDRVSDRPDPER